MAKGNGRLPIYKSYVFRDKDPCIDELRTVIEDVTGEKLGHHTLFNINVNGGPSTGAMSGWFFGKTKRPQNATIEAAGRALGWHREWKKGK
jgi:hypothetical protein